MTIYRGKYPNNIRTVSCGRDRIIHIYTMAGDHFTCTGEQARYVNTKALPNPGDDSTPYRNASMMPIVSLTVDASAKAGFCLITDNGSETTIRAVDLQHAAGDAVLFCAECESGGTLYENGKAAAYIIERPDAINGFVPIRT